MYCKNCGRQLKEGTRFCDRCGQSVRKNMQNSQAARHQEIKELQAERLNRKKRMAEKEAKQARNKKRKKNRGTVFLFIVVIVLIALASIILGYNIPGDDSNSGLVSATPSTTATNQSAMSTSTPSASKAGYSEITLSGVVCAYPSDFRSNTTTGNEKMNLTDALGGASMVIVQEGKTGAPADLMKAYLDEIGVDNATEMRAGSDSYVVTLNDGENIVHRKCIIRNGIAVYYEFTYDADSTSKQKYEEYIKYIDSQMK